MKAIVGIILIFVLEMGNLLFAKNIYLDSPGNNMDIQPVLNNAVLGAENGDIIILPEGDFVFNYKIYVKKNISIVGTRKNGEIATTLYRSEDVADATLESTSWNPMISYSTLPNNEYVILKDIRFKSKTPSYSSGDGGSLTRDKAITFEYTQKFIVTGCEFMYFGYGGIVIRHEDTSAKGLIYNNRFIHNYKGDGLGLGYGVAVYGRNSERLENVDWGTDNFIFIEDNYFEQHRHSVAGGGNGMYVCRYNTIVNNLKGHAIDAHEARKTGSNYYSTRAVEAYGNNLYNTLDRNGKVLDENYSDNLYVDYAFKFRGGEGIVFNNKIRGYKIGLGVIVYIYDDDTSYPIFNQTGYESGLKYGEDHTGIEDGRGDGDLYVWDNDFESMMHYPMLTNLNTPSYFREDRDYHFLKKPGYEPYQYPHPARAEVSKLENILGGNIIIEAENNTPIIADQDFSISDTLVSGQKIGQVVAQDPDEGQILSYTIENLQEYFSINETTGELFLENVENLAEMNTVELTIQITDSDENPLSSDAVITIYVEHIPTKNTESPTDSSNKGTFIDNRDGQTYQTVLIGEQWWMAENLNFGNQIEGDQNQMNNNTVEKYCYDDLGSNCSVYGGLYQWEEMMQYQSVDSLKGICPEGWHLPSEKEWLILEKFLGISGAELEISGARGTDQGLQLQQGEESGFEGLLAGKKDSGAEYKSLNEYATFWNSSGNNRTISNQWSTIYRSLNDDKKSAFSVRCIKDSNISEEVEEYMGPKFYIDPNTESTNSDGSINNPFKSWSDIKWQDSCEYLQKCGTISEEEGILIAAENVYLGSYGTGANPVIISSSTTHAIKIYDKQNTTVQNLDISAEKAINGIYILGSYSTNITIENCKIEGSLFGIKQADGRNSIFRYNTFENQVSAIHTMADNTEIYYNIILGNEVGIDIASYLADMKISNNVFYQNNTGISSSYSSLELYNNIFYLANQNDMAVNLEIDELLSDHNIFYPEQQGFIQIGNEKFDEFKVYQELTGLDYNSLVNDPLFVDIYNQNFNLLPASPAINRGKTLFYLEDIIGSPVPRNEETDIGVYETNYLKNNIPEENTTEINGLFNIASIKIYPNPTNGIIYFDVNREIYSNIKVIITDITGEIRAENYVNSSYNRLDLSDLPRGIYIVELQNEDERIQEKIILQ